MIHWLLHYFEDVLLTENGAFPNAIPVSLGTPTGSIGIGLKAGALQILQQPVRSASDELQPQTISESFPISGMTYSLAMEPTIDSLLVHLVVDATEQRVLLDAGSDFTINYPSRTLSLDGDVLANFSDATELQLEYNFVGVASMREFEQTFSLEVVAPTFQQAEQLAAIAATILLTNQERAKAAFNTSEHNQGEYLSRHLLSQYQWQSGEALELGNGKLGYRLDFIAQGQIHSIKGIPEGEYGIIESIHSPGQPTSGSQPINVVPELG